MRRWLGLLLGALALVVLVPGGAVADAYDPQSADDLQANGWEDYTGNDGPFNSGEEYTRWCKTVTDITDKDREVFPIADEDAQEAIQGVVTQLSRAQAQGSLEGIVEEDTDYAMLCVDLEQTEPEGDFFCVRPNYNLPPMQHENGAAADNQSETCWDAQGNHNQGWFDEALDVAADPAGAAVNSMLTNWVTELNHGVRWFLAMLLYWWILLPHPDIEQSTAAVMWPPMLGLGMGLGIVLLAWKGIKMMFSSRAGAILVDTIKGLAYFAVWCIVGIGIIGTLSHASESLTEGILRYSLDASQIGCAEYQAEQRQPDGMDLTFPDDPVDEDAEEGRATNAEIGRAFGSCVAAQMSVTLQYGGWIMLFYIIAFIVSLIQGLLLFIREAAMPVMALLLPIAAAGQVGGSTTKRWLPNLLTMMFTLLAYKPMVALVFAVGFTSANLSDNVLDILRGLLTLMVGVIAPAVLIKAFKPIAASAVEEAGSMGSVVNNAFLATQLGGSVNNFMEKQAAQRAAKASQAHAASQAAHQGGGLAMSATKAGTQAAGTAAATAAGPVGWAAKLGQALKSGVKAIFGHSEGPQAGATGRVPHHQPGAQPHQPGAQPGHGLQMRESGTGPYQNSPTAPGDPGHPMPHPGAGPDGLPEPYGTMPPPAPPHTPDPGPGPGPGPSGEPPLPPPAPDPGPPVPEQDAPGPLPPPATPPGNEHKEP